MSRLTRWVDGYLISWERSWLGNVKNIKIRDAKDGKEAKLPQDKQVELFNKALEKE